MRTGLILKGVCAAFVAGMLVLSCPAQAAKGGNGKGNSASSRGQSSGQIIWSDSDDGKSKGKSASSSKGKGDKKVTVFIGDRDRVVLDDYVRRHYRAHCPPGLAKKNPPCIPPGQAKKLAAGTILERGSYERLPHNIVERLTPPPYNGMYVRVDKNVYLIDQGTRKILDGVMLLSAVD